MKGAAEHRRILVTGGSGQVGHELMRELAVLGQVIAPTSAELDLASPDAVRTTVRALRPHLIVNAAAYTLVDRAEQEPERAQAINATAPGILAEEARRLGGAMVHYSTDYVFDGTATRPYLEDDPTGPLGVYGATKLEGERAVQALGGAHLVLRTSWVYGLRGSNFLRTMLRLARERSELRVVDDQTGAPTWSRIVAVATAHLLGSLRSTGGGDLAAPMTEAAGVYHIASRGRTTWHGFAEALLAGDPARAEQRCAAVIPITSAEYPMPARRPAFSVLDTGKLERQFGITMPGWREQLALVLGDLAR